MNTNFNTTFQKLMPYITTILVAYVISTFMFISLPKSGIDLKKDLKNGITYEKYEGFYSKVSSIKKGTKKTQNTSAKIETLQKYTLKAVYSTSTNGGWAIIEDKKSKKSTILEQSEKFTSYTLTKLYKNYVVFERDLKEYKLELPKQKDANYEIQTNSSIKKNIVIKEDSVSVNRSYLNSYVNNLDKVWNDIAIKDIRKNGKIQGFKINRVKRNSVFSKLGLKTGDIIKSVNGQIIQSYADAFKIYNELNKLEFLIIEVLRNNELMELNYEID